MPELITRHVWRPTHSQPGPRGDRRCEYSNCGRPRTEHAKSVSGPWTAS